MPLQPGPMTSGDAGAPDENEPQNAPEESDNQAQGEAEVPVSLFGDTPPQAGDKVTLEVRSVDDQSGTVTVCKPAAPAKKQLGVKAMAAAFD